jgi:hypothetical protein
MTPWPEAATVSRGAIREVADLYYERFDGRLEKGLAEVRAEFRTDLARQHADLVEWMFVFWVGTVATLSGLLIALTKL